MHGRVPKRFVGKIAVKLHPPILDVVDICGAMVVFINVYIRIVVPIQKDMHGKEVPIAKQGRPKARPRYMYQKDRHLQIQEVA